MEPRGDARDMALRLQRTDWLLQAEIRQPKPSKRVSQVGQWLRISLPMQETWVQCLGREDLLEKEMANPSRILAWKIPWTKEPGRLQSMGLQTVAHKWAAEPLSNWATEHIYTQAFQLWQGSKNSSALGLVCINLWISEEEYINLTNFNAGFGFHRLLENNNFLSLRRVAIRGHLHSRCH